MGSSHSSRNVAKDIKQAAKGSSYGSGLDTLKNKLKGSVVDPSQMEVLVGFFSDSSAIEKKYLDIGYILKQLDGGALKVKLVIIDLEKWKEHKVLAFIVSNVTDLCGFTQYGLVHVGIQIGSCIIHWFNDSLVHFTDIASSSPLLAADVGSLDINRTVEVLKLQNLCKLAVEYNMNKKYDNKSCNCHHFSRDALKELGFDPEATFKGQIGQYLRKLRTNILDREYTCPITQKKYVFQKHYELDDYSNETFAKVPLNEYKEKYPDDFALLKAFDRAFWLMKCGEDRKNYNDQKEENVVIFGPKKCPFNDPFSTGTWITPQ